jgi:hypothetical protein
MHVTTILVKSRDFQLDETESNTLVMRSNEHYNIIMSGASHARNFTRSKNNFRIEKILNKSVTNIGQGASACSVEEQFFYLKYFYWENNVADQLVYVLSPPLLYSKNLPIASNTFNSECFSFKFLFRYLNNNGENKRQRVFEYIRSKLSLKWIFLKPIKEDGKHDFLKKIDPEAVKEGVATIYDKDTIASEKRFQRSCSIVEEEIIYTLAHNTKIVFVIPPALFGKWPGHENTVDFAKRMQAKYGVTFYDFAEVITDPKYYYDHHHLNTNGVVYFTEQYLKPIL